MKVQQLSAPQGDTTFIRPSKLNIMIGDASGSMYWAMGQLAKDFTDRINALPQGDAVLIGLFSSEGWFKWIATRELSSQADYDMVTKIIDKEFYTRGMTCFSEIMGDVPQAIKPLLSKFPVVSLTFMSDGHPVVSNTTKEIKNLMDAADLVKNYLTSGAVVAYGDYANRQLLGELAKTLGAEFVSAATVEEVGAAFARVSGGKATKKKKVSVPKSGVVFAVENGAVAPLDNSSGEVSVPETSSVYIYDSGVAAGLGEEADVYAAALALLVMGQIDESLKVVSDLGDVAVVKSINNAITNAELKKSEDLLRTMILNPDLRFMDGKQPGCLPPDDAFDLMDLIGLLQNDDNCLFYPYNPSFNYKRTGRKSTVDPKYPKFQADNQGVPLSHVTGHSSELNFSVGLNIKGSIELPDSVEFEGGETLKLSDTGLEKTYRTNIFRNYSLVSNGLPAVTALPITCSQETLDKLAESGVQVDKIINTPDAPGKPGTFAWLVDVTSVPVCNKARGKSSCNWQWMADQAVESLRIGSELKVYKAKKAELDPDGESDVPVELTDEQAAYLEACGVTVKTGVFNPPSKQEEATDVMDVRTFEIKVAKSSSVTMKDFLAKVGTPDKLNAVGKLMLVAHQDIEANMPKSKGSAIEWLNGKIKDLTKQKRALDAELSAAKFAVILGGHWAKHFNEDSTALTSNGWDVTLQVGTIQKKI